MIDCRIVEGAHPAPGPAGDPVLLDSIAEIGDDTAGRVVVTGSHGGLSATRYVLALAVRPAAVFCNDAGGGKDDAGILALRLLEAEGVIAAAYSHRTARIGEAGDGLANGVLSGLNLPARAAGLRIGEPVADAVARLVASAGQPRPDA